VPWYLLGIALLPLVIPVVAIPLQLLVGGFVGGALWGAVGGGLAVVCLAVARRRTLPSLGRAAIALALAGLGFEILLAALVVNFLLLGIDAVARPLPAVVVEAAYPGANAQVLADTVAAPIEHQIIGVEGMIAMRSQCHNDGSYTLTITFKRGADPDVARVVVANRESLAEAILPDLVKRGGVTIKTASPGVLMLVNVFSPDGSRDALYLGNYATLHLRDELTRLPGVGDVTFVGQRHYGVRAWLDRERLVAHDLSAADVVRAMEEQNVQVAAGPAPEGPIALDALGRLVGAEEFGNIILKVTPGGAAIRLKDVAQFELGGGPGQGAVLLDGKPAAALVVHLTPQANPRELRTALGEELERQRGRLPAGIEIDTAFDFAANLAAAARWETTPGYLLLDVDLPPGASPERRLKLLEHCAAIVRQVRGVQDVLAMTEHPFDRQRERSCALVRLGSAGGKSADREQLVRAIRAQLGAVEEARVRLCDLSAPGRCWGCRYPIELAIHGPEAAQVGQFAEKLAVRLRQDPGLTDVWAGSDIPPHRGLTVAVDADAARAHGVAMAEVFNTLQIHLGELWINNFNRFGRTWQVTAGPGAGVQAEELKKLRVRNTDGRLVPLSDLIAVHEVEAPSSVERLNGLPMVAITANPASGVSLAQARALCEAQAAEVRRELGLSAEYQLAWL
jgi:multidrug efflux pump subunit AcrB